MHIRWWADDGPLIVVFGSSQPSTTKIKEKNVVKVGAPLTKFSGSAHACLASSLPGPVAQSVASLTADPGVLILIPDRSHTFVEIGHEILYIVI